jgi:hypothetical protein
MILPVAVFGRTIYMVLTNLDGVENAKSLQEFLALPGQRSMKTTTVAFAFSTPSRLVKTMFMKWSFV